jgi:hypothetical protein
VAGESKSVLTVPEPTIGTAEAETASESDEPAPKITFEKVVHDFGELGPGTKNVCEFNFTNTGDGLLKITKVSKTCGCTPYTLAKKDYVPGESGVLKVKYNAASQHGPIRKRLYVSSNDKSNPKIALTIKAKIKPKISYRPKMLNLLLSRENAGCPEITLASLDGKPFSIKQFKSTADCITADYDSSIKATRFVLQPKVNMEKLRKGLNGRVDIRLTHPESDKVIIPFKVLPKFKINPPSIIVLNAEPQKPVKRRVWVLNNYDKDFEVESASSKKGIIRVLSQKKNGNRYEFELEITPPAAETKKKFFSDEFFVNIKGGEKLKITCRGFYSKKQENRPADKG